MTRPEGAFFSSSKSAHSMKFSVMTNDLVNAKQAKRSFFIIKKVFIVSNFLPFRIEIRNNKNKLNLKCIRKLNHKSGHKC